MRALLDTVRSLILINLDYKLRVNDCKSTISDFYSNALSSQTSSLGDFLLFYGAVCSFVTCVVFQIRIFSHSIKNDWYSYVEKTGRTHLSLPTLRDKTRCFVVRNLSYSFYKKRFSKVSLQSFLRLLCGKIILSISTKSFKESLVSFTSMCWLIQ